MRSKGGGSGGRIGGGSAATGGGAARRQPRSKKAAPAKKSIKTKAAEKTWFLRNVAEMKVRSATNKRKK